MNRRAIFAVIAALWGARKAAGQPDRMAIRQPQNGDLYRYRAGVLSLVEYGKPNQCPVCATIAEPYKRPKLVQYSPAKPCGTDRKFSSELCVQEIFSYDGPEERVTRCKRCNCAFFQDAVN